MSGSSPDRPAPAGGSPYERLTRARAAAALTSPVGMTKNVPESARFVVAVAGAEPGDPQVTELVAELDRRQTESLVVVRSNAGTGGARL